MLEQMQWRSPFGDLPDAWKGRRFRRAPWPKRGDLVWHIWHTDDCGDQSTFAGGLAQGWGGQLGAENSEIVSVNGIEQRDGTMYRPTYDDLRANDWEVEQGTEQ
jgi:hypothetical protein